MISYNNKVLKINDLWLTAVDYNPLNLPKNTFRVRTNDGNPPIKITATSPTEFHTTYETATLVEGTTDVYDIYKSGTDWKWLIGGSSNVVEIIGGNTAGITNMDGLARNTAVSGTALFDTSRVTNMAAMFESTNIKTIPIFPTYNCEDMNHMFWDCSSLEEIPNIDTSKVKDFWRTFGLCYSLEHGPEIDTSSALCTVRMFQSCTGLIDVPVYDVASVTSITEMYSGCTSLTKLPDIHNDIIKDVSYNTRLAPGEGSYGTDYLLANRACVEVGDIDLPNVTACRISVPAVTSVGFINLPKLKESGYTYLGNMLEFRPNLISIEGMNVSECYHLDYMFQSCSGLVEVPPITARYYEWTTVRVMFDGCVNVTGGALDLYNVMSQYVTGDRTYHEGAFHNCGKDTITGAAELAQIPIDWKEYSNRISYATVSNGTLTGPSYAFEGDTVSVTVNPASGYTLGNITVNGNSIAGTTFTMPAVSALVSGSFVQKPPLSANTVRVRTSDGNAPNKGSFASYETATLVEGTNDVYDVYKSGTSFMDLLFMSTNVVEVLDANTNGITGMAYMFSGCTSLISVPLFDTSSVTYMRDMFHGCTSLTSVPLFDTSSATDMRGMLSGCTSVESGALALYNQASTQTTPPSQHNGCFTDCGSGTTTGAAELAQIPSDWK
jgi:surface protein